MVRACCSLFSLIRFFSALFLLCFVCLRLLFFLPKKYFSLLGVFWIDYESFLRFFASKLVTVACWCLWWYFFVAFLKKSSLQVELAAVPLKNVFLFHCVLLLAAIHVAWNPNIYPHHITTHGKLEPNKKVSILQLNLFCGGASFWLVLFVFDFFSQKKEPTILYSSFYHYFRPQTARKWIYDPPQRKHCHLTVATSLLTLTPEVTMKTRSTSCMCRRSFRALCSFCWTDTWPLGKLKTPWQSVSSLCWDIKLQTIFFLYFFVDVFYGGTKVFYLNDETRRRAHRGFLFFTLFYFSTTPFRFFLPLFSLQNVSKVFVLTFFLWRFKGSTEGKTHTLCTSMLANCKTTAPITTATVIAILLVTKMFSQLLCVTSISPCRSPSPCRFSVKCQSHSLQYKTVSGGSNVERREKVERGSRKVERGRGDGPRGQQILIWIFCDFLDSAVFYQTVSGKWTEQTAGGNSNYEYVILHIWDIENWNLRFCFYLLRSFLFSFLMSFPDPLLSSSSPQLLLVQSHVDAHPGWRRHTNTDHSDTRDTTRLSHQCVYGMAEKSFVFNRFFLLCSRFLFFRFCDIYVAFFYFCASPRWTTMASGFSLWTQGAWCALLEVRHFRFFPFFSSWDPFYLACLFRLFVFVNHFVFCWFAQIIARGTVWQHQWHLWASALTHLSVQPIILFSWVRSPSLSTLLLAISPWRSFRCQEISLEVSQHQMFGTKWLQKKYLFKCDSSTSNKHEFFWSCK